MTNCADCGKQINTMPVLDMECVCDECAAKVIRQKCGIMMKDECCNVSRIEEFEKDNAILSLLNSQLAEQALKMQERIAELERDNQSLIEQVNACALKPNQEVVTWHNYPEEKPDSNELCLVEITNSVNNRTIDMNRYINPIGGFDDFGNFVERWAYLPKGVTNE